VWSLLQEAAPHVVRESKSWHAPLPSQKPSWPQGASEAQKLWGSESARAGRHWPSAAPVYRVAHAMHPPAHAFSQHTSSTQELLWHWLPLLQASPLPFFGGGPEPSGGGGAASSRGGGPSGGGGVGPSRGGG
jgi:hypothetical protein